MDGCFVLIGLDISSIMGVEDMRFEFHGRSDIACGQFRALDLIRWHPWVYVMRIIPALAASESTKRNGRLVGCIDLDYCQLNG